MKRQADSDLDGQPKLKRASHSHKRCADDDGNDAQAKRANTSQPSQGEWPSNVEWMFRMGRNWLSLKKLRRSVVCLHF